MTFAVGQMVPLPTAPGGLGQVEDLGGRSRVGLLYLRRGRLCRTRVRVADVARLMAERPLLPVPDNQFARGVRPRAKTFKLEESLCQRR